MMESLRKDACSVGIGGGDFAGAGAAGVVVDETGGAGGRAGAVAIDDSGEVVEAVFGRARKVGADGLVVVDGGVDQGVPTGDQVGYCAAVLDPVHLDLRAQGLKLGAGGLIGGISAGVGKVGIDQRAQDAENNHDDQYFDEGKSPSVMIAVGERSHNRPQSKFRRKERSRE